MTKLDGPVYRKRVTNNSKLLHSRADQLPNPFNIRDAKAVCPELRLAQVRSALANLRRHKFVVVQSMTKLEKGGVLWLYAFSEGGEPDEEEQEICDEGAEDRWKELMGTARFEDVPHRPDYRRWYRPETFIEQIRWHL